MLHPDSNRSCEPPVTHHYVVKISSRWPHIAVEILPSTVTHQTVHNFTFCLDGALERGLLQNDKVHQDIVYCFRTETYILYENLILQQSPPLKSLPKKRNVRLPQGPLPPPECWEFRLAFGWKGWPPYTQSFQFP